MSEKQEEKKVGFFQRTKRNLLQRVQEGTLADQKRIADLYRRGFAFRSSNCLDDLGSRFGSWCSFWIDFVD